MRVKMNSPYGSLERGVTERNGFRCVELVVTNGAEGTVIREDSHGVIVEFDAIPSLWVGDIPSHWLTTICDD